MTACAKTLRARARRGSLDPTAPGLSESRFPSRFRGESNPGGDCRGAQRNEHAPVLLTYHQTIQQVAFLRGVLIS